MVFFPIFFRPFVPVHHQNRVLNGKLERFLGWKCVHTGNAFALTRTTDAIRYSTAGSQAGSTICRQETEAGPPS